MREKLLDANIDFCLQAAWQEGQETSKNLNLHTFPSEELNYVGFV